MDVQIVKYLIEVASIDPLTVEWLEGLLWPYVRLLHVLPNMKVDLGFGANNKVVYVKNACWMLCCNFMNLT